MQIRGTRRMKRRKRKKKFTTYLTSIPVRYLKPLRINLVGSKKGKRLPST